MHVYYYPKGTFVSESGPRGAYLELTFAAEMGKKGDGKRWALEVGRDGICALTPHPKGFKMRNNILSVSVWERGLPEGDEHRQWETDAEVDEDVVLFQSPWLERPSQDVTVLPTYTVDRVDHPTRSHRPVAKPTYTYQTGVVPARAVVPPAAPPRPMRLVQTSDLSAYRAAAAVA